MTSGWKTRRPRGNTTQAIYRGQHPNRVRAARAALREAGSAPCPIRPCQFGGTLYATDLDRYYLDPRYPHLDHCPTCKGHGCARCGGTGYRGLAHNRCNISDGARRGNQARQATISRQAW